MVNLKHDWLMMMSLSGGVVSFYHVTSWYIRRCLRLWLEFGLSFWLDFGTLGYSSFLEALKLDFSRFNKIIKL